ncbi:hypothetical protein HRW23_23290 [Streptomyces lunaelactis]|uniref:hypothetical protein n=1 Tax=Streptomyces lunaelactis TaxID=1535768 RepID=UPI001585A5A6|nr:hypothetical protein [Streptomyces lunaelactis]NUJ99813.1 hypothetical protein [Streptomyces lunaelactis]NUK13919.1 hypothetical protein [Streptomyces lunaelactis]NUK32748.1 hypothetical protein [Streptomyces lunaelactis]NUK39600.1 hypothetical protein [Streptomyces lunaelactis]NUK48777.1 hypothetical protein [Streptomyces lunaelactis]
MVILTVTASQHLAVLEDFRDFVRTVRPDTGDGFVGRPAGTALLVPTIRPLIG